MNNEPSFPYKEPAEVSTGNLETYPIQPVGPTVRDQNGNPITWAEFCRRVKETVEQHEREHPDCERPVFTIDHYHADK